jgi:S-adenosylmethionine decarboxylase
MKTCGTTTLLRCLGSLLEFADSLGMLLTWVGYSRKNLQFPTAQAWPHCSFPDEIQYISTHKKLQSRLKGTGHILGPVTGDHWYVYVADHSKSAALLSTPSLLSMSCERTINLMMFDMAPAVARTFFLANVPNAKDMTHKAGIHCLCPGAQIDETAFTPCGYSMNAILHDSYSTIHVTPELECSYASFETNTSLNCYDALVRNVLNVFKPTRFVLTLFGDEDALDNMASLPTRDKLVKVSGLGVYARTAASTAKVDADLGCIMACYSLSA